MKYIKEVEAFQWFGDERQTEDPIWFISLIEEGTITIEEFKNNNLCMKKSGLLFALPGDYITISEGHIEAVRRTVFEKEYKQIEEINL